MPRIQVANSPKEEQMMLEEASEGSSKEGDDGSSMNSGALRRQVRLQRMTMEGGEECQ